MISAASPRNMIPPAGGWPSARHQCRTAATIEKQHGQPYTGNIGRHWFTLENGYFRQPYTGGGAYCRTIAARFLNSACAEPDKAAKRDLLAKARQWRKDAVFTGWRLP